MASISLAMAQGAKNAQDIARGQINTMKSMAEDAKATMQAEEYADPVAIAIRDRSRMEQQQKLDSLKTLDKYQEEMKKNPILGAAKIFSNEFDSTVAQTPDGRYIVTGPDGSKIMYETQAELVDAANRGLTATTTERITYGTAKADAQIAARTKAMEKDMENASAARHIFDPRNAADIEKAKIGAGATITAAREGAAAEKYVAGVKQTLTDKDKYDMANYLASTTTGVTVDKEGNYRSPSGMAASEAEIMRHKAATAAIMLNGTRKEASRTGTWLDGASEAVGTGIGVPTKYTPNTSLWPSTPITDKNKYVIPSEPKPLFGSPVPGGELDAGGRPL